MRNCFDDTKPRERKALSIYICIMYSDNSKLLRLLTSIFESKNNYTMREKKWHRNNIQITESLYDTAKYFPVY